MTSLNTELAGDVLQNCAIKYFHHTFTVEEKNLEIIDDSKMEMIKS